VGPAVTPVFKRIASKSGGVPLSNLVRALIRAPIMFPLLFVCYIGSAEEGGGGEGGEVSESEGHTLLGPLSDLSASSHISKSISQLEETSDKLSNKLILTF
jgi:hypothetical protein